MLGCGASPRSGSCSVSGRSSALVETGVNSIIIGFSLLLRQEKKTLLFHIKEVIAFFPLQINTVR